MQRTFAAKKEPKIASPRSRLANSAKPVAGWGRGNKAFVGGRLRRLREARGLTQVALARTLGLSASYLNQLEHDQRPLTEAVRQKLTRTLGVEPHALSDADDAKRIAELRDALVVLPPEQNVSTEELRRLVVELPAIGSALLALQKRYRDAAERAEAFASRIGDNDRAERTQAPMPYEEVRDFFYARHNYFAELEDAAERIGLGAEAVVLQEHLSARLSGKHGVRVVAAQLAAQLSEDSQRITQRSYDPKTRLLALHPHLGESQRVYQLAIQLAFLEAGSLLTQLAKSAKLSSPEARALARIGLASYFAGALIMPYRPFLEEAERLRYDLDALARRFGVGFESVCHRVSTLQRPNARGVPFFFVRVDRAGNISKRQSATDFHFSRVGGTCPLWNVYEAFAQPGRILTQLAQMPDGRTYLWIARSVTSGFASYGAPAKTFAIGLGCDVRHGERLVYSKGLDLKDPEAPTKIGAGCKVCEREDCAQRAFPAIGKKLAVDEHRSRFDPYSVK